MLKACEYVHNLFYRSMDQQKRSLFWKEWHVFCPNTKYLAASDYRSFGTYLFTRNIIHNHILHKSEKIYNQS